MDRRLSLNRSSFQPTEPDPEMEAFNHEVEESMLAVPPLQTLTPEIIREAREQGLGVWGPFKVLNEVRERMIPGPGGDVPVRILIPERVRGVYLHLHGGGFVLGRAHHHDESMEALARDADLATVSVDYRLAPENPYPAGPDDCEAAAVWLAENAAAEFGTDRLLIGGESAGANLTVVTLLRLRDRHGFQGFRAANLSYGVFDLSMTPSARNWGDRPLIINTPLMRWFNDHYASGRDLNDPDISPLYADLSGLPPALFTVGDLDPLLDDTLFMYGRWLAAGNRADLALHPGAIHAFNTFPQLKAAREANARIGEFLKRALD